MEALYDQSGSVYAWLQMNGHICGLDGENLAFIDGDSVYEWDGKHIGWWQDGHIRDASGAVALFRADATNMGVFMPMRQVPPLHPLRPLSPHRPVKTSKPLRPKYLAEWSDEMPF